MALGVDEDRHALLSSEDEPGAVLRGYSRGKKAICGKTQILYMTTILIKITILYTTTILTKIYFLSKISSMAETHDSQKIVQQLTSALRATAIRPPSGPDQALRLEDGRLVTIEIKRTPSTRSEDLIGRMATGAIELRKARQGLVVISMPHVTASAAASIEAFVQRNELPVGWALVGDDGTFAMKAQGVEVGPRPRRLNRRAPLDKSPFSDLNCWLLKILLLQDARAEVWPLRRSPILTPAQFAAHAEVSAVTVNRFLRVMTTTDYLRETDTGPVIVRRRELLRAWFAWHVHQRVQRTPVRWLLGTPRSLHEVFERRVNTPTRYCVTSFEAASQQGMSHATYDEREVHVHGSQVDAVRTWKLEACDERDAHFVLLRSPLVESIFRGRVKRNDIWVADPLQIALDASLHAARGEEQASHIIRDVLGEDL